ncbi:hypothetical protein HDU93_005942, partial [Gonapodya sp. JEL0774]
MPPATHLQDLPPEILLAVGCYLDHRLGLPTGALNRHLVSIFRQPANVAARELARERRRMRSEEDDGLRMCGPFGEDDVSALIDQW